MREKIKDVIRLKHILQNIEKAEEWKQGLKYEDLVTSNMCFYALVKCVEIIGEATYMLTKEFRDKHPEVPWEVIAGMRHVLVHEYYNIDAETLWNTLNNDLHTLKPFVIEYIKELDSYSDNQ